jgi:hypothetical protein
MFVPEPGLPLGMRWEKQKTLSQERGKVLPLCQNTAVGYTGNSRFQSEFDRENYERFMLTEMQMDANLQSVS